MNVRKRKKPVVLGRAAAVRRIDMMLKSIEENVKISLQIKAVLEEANKAVKGLPPENKAFYGAHSYNSAKSCMALNLAISLARLFDRGAIHRHPNKSDIASIPLLVRLLKQRRCAVALSERAADWTSDKAICEQKISDAIKSYSKLRKSHTGRRAMSMLKEFRDKKLAHSLLNMEKNEHPKYNQLFLLMDVACEVAAHAKLAAFGGNINFQEFEDEWRRDARAFWRPALRAAALSDGNDLMEDTA